MTLDSIIAAIDTEIFKLQQARLLIAGATTPSVPQTASRRGRPLGSKNAVKSAPAKAKRTMSEEGRARIAAAQKKRWAAKNRAAKKGSTA